MAVEGEALSRLFWNSLCCLLRCWRLGSPGAPTATTTSSWRDSLPWGYAPMRGLSLQLLSFWLFFFSLGFFVFFEP
ncbi:MAG: hypothetical protein QXO86_05660 [Nitrososphaerota archaeon]